MARPKVLRRFRAGAAVAGSLTAADTGALPESDFERKRHIARRLESFDDVLLETVTDDAIERGRNVCACAVELRRIFLQDRRHRVGSRVAFERSSAGQHFVQHGAERKEVRASIDRLSANLLGRHVADRAHHRAGIGSRRENGRLSRGAVGWPLSRRGRSREPEVQDLHAPVAEQEDVVGFQIAMDDTLVVSGRETAGHLNGAVGRFTDRQRTLGETLAQRLAVEELHHRVRVAVLGAHVEDRQDVRV